MDPSQDHAVPSSGYVAAFRSTRTAKNCFMLLVAAAIISQLAIFVAVYWGNVLDSIHRPAGAETTAVATQPGGPTAAAIAAEPRAVSTATFWNEVFHWSLPAAKFLAFAACLLAVLTLMLAVKLAIMGRLGGVGGFTSTFYWSILLLAIVTPWQQILGGGFAAGALYNLRELTDMTAKIKASWGATGVEPLGRTIYFARFAAYPAFALLVWLAVMLKFSAGYKASALHPIGTVPAAPPSEPPPPQV